MKWVEEYISQAEEVSFLGDLSWVVTGINVNKVVMILESYAAMSSEWAGRQVLQFDTAETEALLFRCR
jgi:hypothetical protein